MAEDLDPRILRSRAALREALAKLLQTRSFDEISLNEIAAEAGLNRVTLYKHYADKFALLDAWIADDLERRLFEAFACCEPTGRSKLAAAIRCTCECMRWVFSLGQPNDRLLRPIAEARMRALLLQAIDLSIEQKIMRAVVKRDVAATMASAAICGTAVAWATTTKATPQALAAHVENTIQALEGIIVGRERLPTKLTRTLKFL